MSDMENMYVDPIEEFNEIVELMLKEQQEKQYKLDDTVPDEKGAGV